MDEFKQDTPEPAWISTRNRIESHEDIILSPRFSTIERFLVCEREVLLTCITE